VIVVVSGVSGVGKTTVGERLAAELGWEFLDADDFHPPANVAKMRAGTPLDEADRAPWLARLNAALRRRLVDGTDAVLACSALRREHRRRLLEGVPDATIVQLQADRGTLAARLAGRRHHFMPPSLLDSQLATEESPGRDEPVVVVDASGEPEAVVEAIRRRIAR
jgi:gluconokinase